MKKCIRLKMLDGGWETINTEYRKYLVDKLRDRFEIVYSDHPDYIICGPFSADFMRYDCVKIQVLGENITPDFNLVDYAVGFDYLQFEDRYLRYPIYAFCVSDFELAAKKHLKTEQYYLGKEKFCNFIYSNNLWADKIRTDFYKLLSQYRHIDSGGRVYNNLGYYVDNKLEFQEQYRFSIAFENSRKNGYTTEKIINAFAAGTIPIYWGNPYIVREFNPKAFINVFDYESLEACVSRIIEIDSNEALYLEMQQQPIFAENSEAKIYYEQSDLLADFLTDIFSRPYAQAKRIYNAGTGYNKEYSQIINRGWKMTMLYKRPYRIMRDSVQRMRSSMKRR